MSDQTAAAPSTQGSIASDMTIGGAAKINVADRVILRCLAAREAELAAHLIEQDKRVSRTRHNALEPTRPLVFCDPENGWNEINPIRNDPRRVARRVEIARQEAEAL